jgi:hypothetical protein
MPKNAHKPRGHKQGAPPAPNPLSRLPHRPFVPLADTLYLDWAPPRVAMCRV